MDFYQAVKDMTFKVEPDWQRGFKSLAAKTEMLMKTIFQEAVEQWAVRRYGPTVLKDFPRRRK